MPEATAKTRADAGEVDVAALFAALQEEVRRTGPRHRADASSVRIDARAAAERLWPVSGDRQLAGRQGLLGAAYRPVKLVLRKLMRWYVEPALADQRAVNDALLRLVDDLYDEIDAIRAELANLRGR